MFDDRRRHPRFAVLFTGDARPVNGQPFRVVCTSVSRTGGYFACPNEVLPGTDMVVTLRLGGVDSAEISCRVEAVRITARGGAESPGFGARWHSLACKQGGVPLYQFVVEHLHWAAPPQPEVDPSGLARYDVTTEGTWIGAPVLQPTPAFTASLREADTWVGGIEAILPRSQGLDMDLLQPLTSPDLQIVDDLSAPSRRRSATFGAVNDFSDDGRTLATPSLGARVGSDGMFGWHPPAADAPHWAETPQPMVSAVAEKTDISVFPQAPQAVFAAQLREPSAPFAGRGVAGPTAMPDGASTTLREVPAIHGNTRHVTPQTAASGELPIAPGQVSDKTQP